MKNIIIALFCLLFFQDNENTFKLNNLQKQYKRNDTIKLSINNISNKKATYFVCLYKYEFDWREAVLNIDKPYNKIVEYKVLGKKQKKYKKILINKTFYFLNDINYKKYKLAIVYKLENDTTKRIQFSNSFVIKD